MSLSPYPLAKYIVSAFAVCPSACLYIGRQPTIWILPYNTLLLVVLSMTPVVSMKHTCSCAYFKHFTTQSYGFVVRLKMKYFLKFKSHNLCEILIKHESMKPIVCFNKFVAIIVFNCKDT